ncbi:hypothetical protein [Roseobacter sp. S98]|uniref:hypothetical protein n=1 Tax=Roseobacter algicola (ex Choi et al. 2025) (nom. illeg.) TaxID=3092138 RepID=UPI003F51A8FE
MLSRVSPYIVVALCFAQPAGAQEQPLSAIDWIDSQPVVQHRPIATTPLAPAGEAPERLPPDVSVAPLNEQVLRQIGLVPPAVTGLPPDLWAGSDPQILSTALETLPDLRLPAGQALLYRALLTEAFGPGTDTATEDLFTLARARVLRRSGALEPALALLGQSGPTRDKDHFATFMDLALLTGDEDNACDLLRETPHLAPSEGHRVFCTLRGGDWATAAVLYDAGRALGTIPEPQVNLLARFLDPDLFEGDPALAPPARITPLLFRLHEAIGEPLPTRFLPREYAVADLRDLAGWKAQLEAAERLARAGSLPDNQLLGLYTARRPAASGGVWDRAAAIQELETALRDRDPGRISSALPAAWRTMQAARLEVPFATLFADELPAADLTGDAAAIAQRMMLLSPGFQDARGPGNDLATAIATSSPLPLVAGTARDAAVAAAFSGKVRRATDNSQPGLTILRTLSTLEEGAAGDPVALQEALSTLRRMGFETTARRAALQVLLLDRYNP